MCDIMKNVGKSDIKGASLRAVGHLSNSTDFSEEWRWLYGICVHNVVLDYTYCADFDHKKVTAPSAKVGSY